MALIGNCTVRAWKTAPGSEEFGPNAWHTDGLPLSVFKIMYYPLGADYEKGTIELQTPHGVHAIEGNVGTWVLLKPSEVVHQAIAPQVGERIAIEITIIPSLSLDLNPISAGQNARHPHLPWQQLSSANQFYYKPGDVIGVNIGGGPHWGCSGWVNLEGVRSASNPTPISLIS